MKVEGEGQERDCSHKQEQSIELKEVRKGVCVWEGESKRLDFVFL